MPAGQDRHCVLFELAKVPAAQLGQRDIVSTEIEEVPGLHLEHSCALDARGTRRSYSAVKLLSKTLLILMNNPGPLVTVTAVPPTDATCFGDTALMDAAPPKNVTLCKACSALILELARVPGSCEVNMRHKYPVPTLIRLDSEKKTAIATEDPFTIDSDDVIKLKSELKSV